jgi:copper resistance protein B
MSAIIRRAAFCAAWVLPLAAMAQTVPAPASSTGMGMMAMPGMEQRHDGHARHAGHRRPKQVHAPAKATSQHAADRRPSPAAMSMPMMDHANRVMDTPPAMGRGASMPDVMSGMGRAATPAHAMQGGMGHEESHGMQGMSGMHMQGGAAPSDARSADYSDGIGHAGMSGRDMRDAEPLGMLRFDQLEAFDGLHGNGQAWEMEGWYGTDIDKLRLRSEGEHEGGGIGDGDVEALWSHAVAPYWDTQLGVRHDFGDGPSRDWTAFGVQGLAPYWFELAATAYAGSSGRTAARLRVEYELPFTQRLILQPELELDLYGKADPQRRIGAGLADGSVGLRLRYEIRRRFAPYLGVSWERRFGATAGYARQDHRPVFDRRLVAGIRIWF